MYRLRVMGLAALLALGPDDLVLFFDRFFALPDSVQRAYLSAATDLPVRARPWGVFAALPVRLKLTVVPAAGLPTPRGRPHPKTGLRAAQCVVNHPKCRYCGPAESPGAYRFGVVDDAGTCSPEYLVHRNRRVTMSAGFPCATTRPPSSR